MAPNEKNTNQSRSFLPPAQVAVAVATLGLAALSSYGGSTDVGLRSGCGSPSAWSFDTLSHSNQTLQDRSFLVHLPATYDPNVPHPVVLAYHGFGKSDAYQEKISGFSSGELKINDKGIVAVYPAGAYGPSKDGQKPSRAWQGAPYAKAGIDDIAFTENIIKELKLNLCIDEKRIYAAGKSNGGGFLNLLACTPTTSSLIAAFALVAAAHYPGTEPSHGCNPGRAIPLLHIHGLVDKTIPFGGREANKRGDTGYALPDIASYRKQWALRNGCASTTPSSVTYPNSQTTLEQWDCHGTSVVKGYTVDGLGHSWPTTDGLDGEKTVFDATTAEIVPFFNSQSLK